MAAARIESQRPRWPASACRATLREPQRPPSEAPVALLHGKMCVLQVAKRFLSVGKLIPDSAGGDREGMECNGSVEYLNIEVITKQANARLQVHDPDMTA